MVFHGILVTCLDHLLCFLFEMVFDVVLKDVLERGHRCGNLYNDSCLNVYKDVLSFEKISMFESLILGNVLKLCCEMCFEFVLCFENSKDVFASFDQVTKSCLPYFTQRSFLYVFNPFDSVFLPLHLVNNLVLGC